MELRRDPHRKSAAKAIKPFFCCLSVPPPPGKELQWGARGIQCRNYAEDNDMHMTNNFQLAITLSDKQNL